MASSSTRAVSQKLLEHYHVTGRRNQVFAADSCPNFRRFGEQA